MKFDAIVKVALATGLMLGKIQPVDTYYEDDEDFELTSNVLTDGWNWGINQAQADECSHLEGSARQQCEEEQIERIEVGPQDDYFDSGIELGDFYEQDNDEIQTQPPEGGGAPAEIELEEYNEVNDCESQVELDFRICKNNAKEIANSSNWACHKRLFSDPTAYNLCLAKVDSILTIDVKTCNDIVSDEITKCN